ncbi:gluconate 2-dehydrogenase subunit 3 family protein [Pseudoroseomonas cervicalis]|uniref:gluconate 2-dehydrogenase subunit 3 family protein n=1 Tax=Teichococcus cervicalis TaxID=204525 RepID=UPI002782A0CD|nr:gluconate 2-dehydrogenase subunit 3 family protein [Pseudoroseomonas cervicalis]MDQ1081902.1 gluconate 2-dehydrogenase gamma chain [Pseudoroseomonas cervicalis]
MSDRVLLWRRHLLQAMAAAPAAMMLGTAPPRRAMAQSAAPAGYTVLSQAEAKLLEPIIARLIPSDDLGPGALDSGVASFIDRQLATPWAAGDHFYAQGPFHPGVASQGYQLQDTPAALVRKGLARLAEMVPQQRGGRSFDQLSPAEQDALLGELERGELDLSPVPGPLFFQSLLDITIEGYFADPLYGGNKDMVGWKLVGFPGYYSSYVAEIERHNLPFRRPPQSLADLARAHAEDHQHGLPPSPQSVGPSHAGHEHGGMLPRDRQPETAR